jgi:hypothetical protein
VNVDFDKICQDMTSVYFIGGDKQLRPLTVFVQYTFITVRFSAEYQTMYQLDAIDANNLISVAEHDWFVSHMY